MELKPPYGWHNMTEDERKAYATSLGDKILEHKYRYYVLDENIISDFEYDYLERLYEQLCKLLNITPLVTDMVGWNLRFPGAEEAMKRVLEGKK